MTDPVESQSFNNADSEVDLARWCYACGELNPIGLHLHFQMDAEKWAEAEFIAQKEHQGYPGFVHGGLVTTLLDEAMGWATCWATYGVGIWALTGKMETRFREPVPIGQPLFVRGHIERDRGRTLDVFAELRAGPGKILAEATAVLFRATGDQAELIEKTARTWTQPRK